MLILAIKRKWRSFRFWLLKKLLSEEERRVIFGLRMGFRTVVPAETGTLTDSFELDDLSHAYMHSKRGEEVYDPKTEAARHLIREKEDELADLVTYTEEQDEETGIWKCTSSLEVVRRKQA